MRFICQKDYPDMPYITRTDPDDPRHEYGKTTTISTSGCGLCAAIMVADRLLPQYDFELEDAVKLSYEIGANHGAGTAREFFPVFAEKLGLKLETSDDKNDLVRCLETGGAAIVLVEGDKEKHTGLFTYIRHYMAVIGKEPDGRLAILDPSFTPDKYEEDHRRGKVEIKCGVIVLCDADTLHAELRKEPGKHYFLFHRA